MLGGGRGGGLGRTWMELSAIVRRSRELDVSRGGVVLRLRVARDVTG